MKRSGELIGRPIISLIDGCEIGTVKSFVFNPSDGVVAAVVVDDGKSFRGAKLIAFEDILGIGDSAITIEQKSSVKPVEQAPELEKLLEANVNIINTKVLTKKGKIKGTIVEVNFDTDTGNIIECCSVDEAGNSFVIPADKIYTYGSGITVITSEDDFSTAKAVASPKFEQPKAATTAQQQVKIEQPSKVIEPPKIVEQPRPVVEQKVELKEELVIQAPKVEEQPKVTKTTSPEPEKVTEVKKEDSQKILEQPKVEESVDIQTDEAAADSIKAMRKFEERQKKFLIGKKATRKIVTDNGTEIIDQGEEVTKEIIQKANLAGKFVELSMSVQ